MALRRRSLTHVTGVLVLILVLVACSSTNVIDVVSESDNASRSNTEPPTPLTERGRIEIVWSAVAMPEGTIGGPDESTFDVTFVGDNYARVSSFGPVEYEHRRVDGLFFIESRVVGMDNVPQLGFSQLDAQSHGEGIDELVMFTAGGMPPESSSTYVARLADAGATITTSNASVVIGSISARALSAVASEDLPAGLANYGATSLKAGAPLVPEEIRFEIQIERDAVLSVTVIVSGNTSAGLIDGNWVATYGQFAGEIEIPNTDRADRIDDGVRAQFAPVNDAFESQIPQDDRNYLNEVSSTVPECQRAGLELYVAQTNESLEALAKCYEDNNVLRAANIVRNVTLE